MTPDVQAMLDVMDACNVATVVNLDGRWGEELRENIERYDDRVAGQVRDLLLHLDWSLLADPGGAASESTGW